MPMNKEDELNMNGVLPVVRDNILYGGFKGFLRAIAQVARERAETEQDGIESKDDLLDMAKKLDTFVDNTLKDNPLP